MLYNVLSDFTFTEVQLSQDQQQALSSLLDWYKAAKKSQFITLGGYAGTGKSSLIALFRTGLKKIAPDLQIAFCSYTGKAARVLKIILQKSNAIAKKDFVGTIHALIYSPVINSSEEIIGWETKKTIDADLIIVDEASMVDENIWTDLLSYQVPVVAVGDHGQLPPINGKFNLMDNPQVRLERVHRQNQDNPIIKLSILAREHGVIPAGRYGRGVIKYQRGKDNGDTEQELADLLAGYNNNTLILCGYNKTRIKINNYVRQMLERESPEPMKGDRVICLRNNHKSKLFNGMLGTIKKISEEDKNWYAAEIDLDDETKTYQGLIAVEQFNQVQGLNFTARRKQTVAGDLFDFGYALTVHKAQGSQAQRVILLEERFPKMTDEDWRRWLYTAVTRAEKELYVFGY